MGGLRRDDLDRMVVGSESKGLRKLQRSRSRVAQEQGLQGDRERRRMGDDSWLRGDRGRRDVLERRGREAFGDGGVLVGSSGIAVRLGGGLERRRALLLRRSPGGSLARTRLLGSLMTGAGLGVLVRRGTKRGLLK